MFSFVFGGFFVVVCFAFVCWLVGLVWGFFVFVLSCFAVCLVVCLFLFCFVILGFCWLLVFGLLI